VEGATYRLPEFEVRVKRSMRLTVRKKAWPLLSESQKTAIADQVIEVRNQLRSITSGSIQTLRDCVEGATYRLPEFEVRVKRSMRLTVRKK
jgi:hypothetical protein